MGAGANLGQEHDLPSQMYRTVSCVPGVTVWKEWTSLKTQMLMKSTWYRFGTSFVAKKSELWCQWICFILTSPFFLIILYCVVMRWVRNTDKWVCFKHDKIKKSKFKKIHCLFTFFPSFVVLIIFNLFFFLTCQIAVVLNSGNLMCRFLKTLRNLGT